MKINVLIICSILSLGIGVLSLNFAAADEQTQVFSQSLKSLEDLKQHIVALMQENNQLEARYALLKREYDTLNSEYVKHAAKIDQLRREREQEAKVVNRRRESIHEMEAQLPDSEANQLVLKSRIAFAQQKLLDEDEQLRMLKLKVSDLEFEMRDIEMAKKIKDYTSKEAELKQSKELQRLKDIYAHNVELEKELLAEIEHIKHEGKNAGGKMDQIKSNNEDLSLRINHARAEIAMRKQENELLRKKKLYEVRLSENKTWQYDQKRLALQESVDKLAAKAESLGEKIELSRNKQVEKREILDTIMRIDQENQSLKDKIFELQQKMKDSKK